MHLGCLTCVPLATIEPRVRVRRRCAASGGLGLSVPIRTLAGRRSRGADHRKPSVEEEA